MGAAAFLMSDFLGVSYFEIIKAAFIPALIYYISLFLMVYFDNKNDDFDHKSIVSELNYKKVLLNEGVYFYYPFSPSYFFNYRVFTNNFSFILAWNIDHLFIYKKDK